MRILVLGDVVGRPGREAIREIIPSLIKSEKIDLAVANAENVSGGAGVDIKSAEELFSAGIHVLTSGNHVWKKKEIYSYLESNPCMLRPANYPDGAPGRGWLEWEHEARLRVLIINLEGRIFMRNLEDPFRCVEKILKEHGQFSPVVLVDMHAEATSEKNAMGWFLDGRVSVVYGTHTHIQTADERILTEGTAYITDLGMCGPMDSVIGVEKETVIEGFLSQLPRRFEVARGNVVLQGILLDVDEATGKAKEIRRIRIPWKKAGD
ncbi:MAG: TIGR00282 family metallophosphoesterase [Candidatus Binatia bacterium]|jgi:metallophosphoesterase (TIGR00282 family)